MRLWTPPKPSIRKRKSLLVEGHKTNWLNCGQKHGHTGFFIRGRLCDGHILFQHWIEDPEDAEDFWRNPIPSWFPSVEDYPGLSYEFSSVTYLTDTIGGNFIRPPIWNDNSNKIECLGGGAPGGPNDATRAGGGGGSGGYSNKLNWTLPVNNSWTVGSGVGNQPTFFGAASQALAVCAANGGQAGITPTGGAGANLTLAIGDLTRVGAKGGDGWSAAPAGCGGGGGGTPGPIQVGGDGGNGSQTIGGNGGDGDDNGLGGKGGLGVTNGRGNNGQVGYRFGVFNSVPFGCGGGAGGGGNDAVLDDSGGNAGSFSAGGGGAGEGAGIASAGIGYQGLIVVTNNPVPLPPFDSPSISFSKRTRVIAY